MNHLLALVAVPFALRQIVLSQAKALQVERSGALVAAYQLSSVLADVADIPVLVDPLFLVVIYFRHGSAIFISSLRASVTPLSSPAGFLGRRCPAFWRLSLLSV